MFDLCLRIVSVPDTVPRAYARLLGEEIRKLVFLLARQPVVHDRVRPCHREGPYGYQRLRLFVTEGNVYQEPDCFCWSWHYG